MRFDGSALERLIAGEAYQDLSDGGDSEVFSGQGALLDSERMARVLDRIRMEMTEDADGVANEQQILVYSTEAVVLLLSLGWLGVLLRAGSLAAVAFSALPLWSRVDPLAVLAISEEERRRLEEDLRKAREAEDRAEKGVGQLLDDR